MLINKNKLKRIEEVLESFRYIPKTMLSESKKLSLPKHIVTYLENEAAGRIQVSPPYNIQNVVEFFVEFFDDVFLLARKLKDGRINRIMLTPEDMKLIRDVNNIELQDVKALVDKIDKEEKRFGL